MLLYSQKENEQFLETQIKSKRFKENPITKMNYENAVPIVKLIFLCPRTGLRSVWAHIR